MRIRLCAAAIIVGGIVGYGLFGHFYERDRDSWKFGRQQEYSGVVLSHDIAEHRITMRTPGYFATQSEVTSAQFTYDTETLWISMVYGFASSTLEKIIMAVDKPLIFPEGARLVVIRDPYTITSRARAIIIIRRIEL